MRGRIWAGWGTAVLVLAACGGSGGETGGTTGGSEPAAALTAPGAMAPGDSAQVGDQILTFVDVSNDARCPADMTCPEVSNVRARFMLRAVESPGAAPTLMELQLVGDSAAVTEAGLTFTLTGVEPARVAGTPIPAADYRVTVGVTRAPTP